MKSQILACTTALALLTGAPFALAQAPVAPTVVSPTVTDTPVAATSAAPGHYTGPSSVPLSTVKNLLENGHDDQPARLQGRIVSHDGGKNYSFADDSGRMTVEISARHFPASQPVSAEQRVELVGELEKGFRKTKFEVKELRLLP
jgi:uncharacterized protein (TIGR00156 family)